jgi:hypothetical protein
MKKINLRNIFNGIKIFVKHFLFYFVFLLSLSVGFSIGYYYNVIKLLNKKTYSSDIIKKKDVTLAIDENNNMILFNKKTGTYSVYQDSVGITIFNFYAKAIWNEQSLVPKK